MRAFMLGACNQRHCPSTQKNAHACTGDEKSTSVDRLTLLRESYENQCNASTVTYLREAYQESDQ